ncbi:Transposon TX1 uncharacterized 149 kDa protein [Vitis vinifera]|uniref:Transposon TX1 uncharacterized 149 kDa protein n=1 Tax=Vitis vinifera TaxID=29760 RepID=A0A438F3C4_VITVI|nr:Transposon TX1 uncharacterized 149 kDa protein [Vitis vinifera]
MQESSVCKRLDRFLYSNEWELFFPQSLQEVLPRWTSDCWLIVLDTNPFKWGPTPFRFENMWLQHPSFKECFSSWWREFEGNGWEGHRDKASGPNGFTIAMFQDCWEVIKEDLVRVFAEFHSSRIINQSTNASFIVLLPKKSQTKKILDFRPISLITCLYKVIAKVLSGRLRGVLHETIHSTQGAFVQGRQILDAVLIANEIVDEKRLSREEGVVFKIDFDKAYDHVNWDF